LAVAAAGCTDTAGVLPTVGEATTGALGTSVPADPGSGDSVAAVPAGEVSEEVTWMTSDGCP